MKTSVIEVREMLSVWSVASVEERVGKVPGVESVTVNYAAGNATVRYDETRLAIGDIRSAVRQSGYQSEDEFLPKQQSEPTQAREGAASPVRQSAPTSAPASVVATPHPASATAGAAADAPVPAAPTAAGDEQQDKRAPNAALPSPAAATQS